MLSTIFTWSALRVSYFLLKQYVAIWREICINIAEAKKLVVKLKREIQ